MRARLASLLGIGFGLAACGGMTSEPPDDGSAPCTEGETKPTDDGCNTCTCSDGSWLCSAMPCIDPDPEPECEEGDYAADGCNVCVCQGGLWSCTSLDCVPGCEDGTTTSDGCNSCTCSSGQWVCSDVYCPPTCEEGTIKAAGDGCNTCSCDSGGWLCTLEACAEPACPLPEDVPPEPCATPPCDSGNQGGPTCAGDELYGRAAGTDACCTLCTSVVGYTYYDSLEACEASKACMPGDTKYADDECNTCTCTSDGVWACTAADCEPVRCGGLSGGVCSEDEYCAYEANQGGCGIADQSSVCRPRPTDCSTNEAPVCGCDGETYSNACIANRAGVGVMTDEACWMPE